MKREFIKSRKGRKIAINIYENDENKGLVFIMHGLGGFQDQDQIKKTVEPFHQKGYTAITFDAGDTIGDSEGNYEDATVTSYYSDLEDVVAWSKTQDFYKEPFVLAGHSLGAFCSVLYAENFPERIKALAPMATVISGKKSLEAHSKEEMEEWKSSGWRVKISNSKPGTVMRLKWSHIEDRLKYDATSKIDKLTMPVLLIVGSEDTVTPYKHQKELLDKLPGKKELNIIEGSQHTFRGEEHLKKMQEYISNWLAKIEN